MVTLVVKEYDEAITFYCDLLGFVLVEDTKRSDTKRWVVIAPPGDTGCRLLLAKAKNEQQFAAVGNQTGGRVFLVIHTDHFSKDLKRILDNNMEVVRGPVTEAHGEVIVFKDLYGNLIDLIAPNDSSLQ